MGHGRPFGRQSDYHSVRNRGAPCRLGARTACGARTARVSSYSGAGSSPCVRRSGMLARGGAGHAEKVLGSRLLFSPGQPRPSEKIGRASTHGVSKHKPGAFELTHSPRHHITYYSVLWTTNRLGYGADSARGILLMSAAPPRSAVQGRCCPKHPEAARSAAPWRGRRTFQFRLTMRSRRAGLLSMSKVLRSPFLGLIRAKKQRTSPTLGPTRALHGRYPVASGRPETTRRSRNGYGRPNVRVHRPVQKPARPRRGFCDE